MLAPIIGGLLFDFVGYSFAALFIAGWNSISVIVEYMLLILIYRFVIQYRGGNKGLYVVAGNFCLLLLNCSAWPCLDPA